MNDLMSTELENYEVCYEMSMENGRYHIIVEEKENSVTTKSGDFQTDIDSESIANELVDMLRENQVGVVHMNDILSEMGYLMKS